MGVILLCALLNFVAWATQDGIIAPATDKVLSTKTFRANVDGAGTARVNGISLQSDLGIVKFKDEEYVAIAYVGQVNFGGYDLFDTLCIRRDGSGLAMIYGYCYPSGSADNKLTAIWSEGYNSKVLEEAATGKCELSANVSMSTHVTLPALRALPDSLDVGIDVRANSLHLDVAGGWIITPDPAGNEGYKVNQTLIPFNFVDCTECPGGPWYEIHSMLHTAPSNACFGILYLFPNDPNMVELEYTFCMPNLYSVDQKFENTPWEFRGTTTSFPKWLQQFPRHPPSSRLAQAQTDLLQNRFALNHTRKPEFLNVLI